MADLWQDALSKQRDYYQATNPYGMAGTLGASLAKADYTGFKNPWVGPMAAALGGFMGGFGQMKSAQDTQSAISADISQLAQALADPAKGQALASDPEKSGLYNAYRIEQAQKQADLRGELSKALATKGLLLGGDGSVANMPGFARAMAEQKFTEDNAWALDPRYAATGAPTAAGQAPSPTAAPAMPGDPDAARFDQLMTQPGMTPDKARTLINTEREPERAQITVDLKAAQEGAERGKLIGNVGSQIKTAIPGAGYTGPGESVYRLGQKVGSAFGNDEAQGALTSKAAFDQVQADIIASARRPGAGATSDFEARTYLSSGPSLSDTPEQNKLKADIMEAYGKRLQDKYEFLQSYLATNKTTLGSEEAWNKYDQDVPIVIKGMSNTGTAPMVNPQAAAGSWREYFSGGMPTSATPKAPAASVNPGGPPPPMAGESREQYKARVRGM